MKTFEEFYVEYHGHSYPAEYGDYAPMDTIFQNLAEALTHYITYRIEYGTGKRTEETEDLS